MAETKTKIVNVTQDWQQNLGKTFAELLGKSAAKLLDSVTQEESPEDITKEWQSLYATPAMQMWSKSVQPIVEEGFNLPGTFYSTFKSKGVANAANDFYNQSVLPSLYSALQSYKDRQVNMAGVRTNILGLGTGMSTSQTMQAVQEQKQSGWDKFASIASTVSSVGSDIAVGGGFAGLGLW